LLNFINFFAFVECLYLHTRLTIDCYANDDDVPAAGSNFQDNEYSFDQYLLSNYMM